MNSGRSKVVAFPSELDNSHQCQPCGKRSVVIVSEAGRDEAIVRQILEDVGQPRTEVRSMSVETVCKTLDKIQGAIALIRDDVLKSHPAFLQDIHEQSAGSVPILVLADDVNQESVGRYMFTGAQDVVSLEHPNHLRSVIAREYDVLQLRRSLTSSLALSSGYKEQIRFLTASSPHGFADVKEGVITGANRAWTEMFGYKDSADLVNTPILDLISRDQQSDVKQLMAERLSSKRRGPAIKVVGKCVDEVECSLNMTLERIRVDGSTTIRFVVWPNSLSAGEVSSRLDPSTSLYSRPYFVEQLEAKLASPLSCGVRVLVYFRPDRFSDVLDAVGVLESERVLRHFADTLRELAHPSDLYGRFGGTDFVALVNRGSVREAEAWATQIAKVVADRPFDHSGTSQMLSCTAGMCDVAHSDISVEAVLQEAHDACNRGRLQSEGKVHLSASSQTARMNSINTQRTINQIQAALKNDRFRLVRNPIIKLDDSDCKIRDTWIRMIGEDGNDILPRNFIPIAERHNLMMLIDRWVIKASATYCAKHDPDLVFVRLSQESILDESLSDWALAVVNASATKAAQVCFQTTEEVAARSMKETIRQASGLVNSGFKFAIDQLGTTTKTMSVLENVPMQYARIDGAIMQGIAHDKSIQAQVEGYVRAAQQRGIHAVGERIEDAATMAAACRAGIEYAQGDHIWHEDIVLEDTCTICTPALLAI